MLKRLVPLIASTALLMGGMALAMPTPDGLSTQFKKAFEKKDFDSFSRLFCWGKADEAMKTMIKQAFESELDQRIANVSILEVPAGLKTSYERNGIQYRTTLPPIAKLQITFEKKKDEAVNAMSFLVGKKGSEYYLLTAEPVSP